MFELLEEFPFVTLVGHGTATNYVASSLHADNSDGGGASDDLINQINVG